MRENQGTCSEGVSIRVPAPSRIGALFAFLCLSNFILVSFAFAEEEAATNASALFVKTVNLRTGVGYKDNVLLSSFQKESSPFWLSQVDIFAARIPQDGVEVSLLVSGDDRRYFTASSLSKEQLLIAHLDLKKKFGPDWEARLSLQYLYSDQVVDASITEQELTSLQVVSHTLGATPVLQRNLPGDNRVELRTGFSRNFFQEPLDDYWQGGPKILFGHAYGNKSDISLGFEIRDRAYDTREQVDENLAMVPDSSLRYRQQEIEFAWRHNWDKGRHWRSALRLGWEKNEDSGPGYFDFRKYRVSKQLGCVADKWEVTSQVKWLYYDYGVQRVSTSFGNRHRSEVLANVRAERAFGAHFKVFGEAESEWSISNEAAESYRVNTVLSGIDFEF